MGGTLEDFFVVGGNLEFDLGVFPVPFAIRFFVLPKDFFFNFVFVFIVDGSVCCCK